MTVAPVRARAGVSGRPPSMKAGRDSSVAMASTIMGMPMKWVAMLRGSRW
jgi:hypothetical protein